MSDTDLLHQNEGELAMITRRIYNFPAMGRQNPFEEMDRMSRQLNLLTNAMFGSADLRFSPSGVFPAVNITEDVKKYYVRAELPGLKADEINLQVSGRNLSISGERKIQLEGKNSKYHRREREEGRFSRIIGLPGDLNADSVEANMVNGVLTIAIAKSEAAKPKQITVK
jgi:HSP20 family protein